MQRHRHLIDLNDIPELSYCSTEDGFLRIGAMTRQRTLLELSLIAEVCPILQDALHVLGHQATRTRGTIGGSLSNMDPSADLFGVSALTRPSDPISEIESICGTLRDSPDAIRAASP
jgi:CO/xanthine dehydrogenase FAD-binding subunit